MSRHPLLFALMNNYPHTHTSISIRLLTFSPSPFFHPLGISPRTLTVSSIIGSPALFPSVLLVSWGCMYTPIYDDAKHKQHVNHCLSPFPLFLPSTHILQYTHTGHLLWIIMMLVKVRLSAPMKKMEQSSIAISLGSS